MPSRKLNIPVEFCQASFQGGYCSAYGAYIVLLMHTDGKVRGRAKLAAIIHRKLGVSPSTAQCQITSLLARGWIVKGRRWFYINGLDTVATIEQYEYKRSVQCMRKDLKSLKAFFIGATITSAIQQTKRREGSSEVKKHISGQFEASLPLSFLTKSLGVSKRTAIRYKHAAVRSGYIMVREDIQPVKGLQPTDIARLHCEGVAQIKVQLKHQSGLTEVDTRSLFIKDGQVYARRPDRVCSTMVVRRRRLHPNRIYASINSDKKREKNNDTKTT